MTCQPYNDAVAIFSFRGADSRLMQAVLDRIGAGSSPELLSSSRRSRPALVTLVSELFARALEGQVPRDQVILTPVRSEEKDLPPALHCWRLQGKNRSGHCAGIAAGVARLLGRSGTVPTPIIDPHTGARRNAVPGDIAVLCRSNSHAAAIAAALEESGVRAALARSGLLATPEATLALACLKRLYDPADSLATAEIVVLTSGDPDPAAWLPERLAFVASGQRPETWQVDHPIVARVDALRTEVTRASPAALLADVVAQADLVSIVQSWGHERVRVGNLDALQGLARSFEERCARYRTAATVPGLLSWLQDVVESEEDDQVEGTGPEAVRVLTYYRAKGLEWPVVVLDDLDEPRTHGPWGLTVTSDGHDFDIEAPLSGRWMRFWPWPYGGQSKGTGLAELCERSPLVIDAVNRELQEDLRLLYVGMTRARDILVLPSLESSAKGLGWIERILLNDGKPIFRLPTEVGDHQVPIAGTGSSVAVRVEAIEPRPGALVLTPQKWVDGSRRMCAAGPARVAASQVAAWPGAAPSPRNILALGRPLVISGTDDMEGVGNAVHAFLGADDPSLGDTARTDLARDIQERFGVARALEPHALVVRADEIRAALASHGERTSWKAECPFEVRVGNQTIAGRIDLLLETLPGYIIVDHKSHAGDRETRLSAAIKHLPQLAVYALGVRRATGRPVVSVMLNFAVAGEIFEYELPESLQELEDLCRTMLGPAPIQVQSDEVVVKQTAWNETKYFDGVVEGCRDWHRAMYAWARGRQELKIDFGDGPTGTYRIKLTYPGAPAENVFSAYTSGEVWVTIPHGIDAERETRYRKALAVIASIGDRILTRQCARLHPSTDQQLRDIQTAILSIACESPGAHPAPKLTVAHDGWDTIDEIDLAGRRIQLQTSADSYYRPGSSWLKTFEVVLQALVHSQREFLLGRSRTLIPLTQKDVGEKSGYHSSVVSRACSGVRLLIDGRPLPLAELFTGRFQREDGTAVSEHAIKVQLQEIVEADPTGAVMSDRELAERLCKEMGIKIARRTVGKYRADLGLGTKSGRIRSPKGMPGEN